MGGKIIALSSTHGCGKSTAIYWLASKLKIDGYNIAVLNELARECPFPINKGGDLRTQSWLFSKQIVRELELCNNYEYVLADRGIIDTIAYAKIIAPEVKFDKLVGAMAYSHIKNNYVTSLILDKDMFNYNVSDGVRDTDPSFRDTIYYELLDMYNTLSIPYSVVSSTEEIYLKTKDYLK